jgi:hypothetical protein
VAQSQAVTIKAIFDAFPNLDPGAFQATSPATPRYNCIAYAAGDQTRWWWPDPDGNCYWPKQAQRIVRLAAFQQAFESLGYALTKDGEFDPGIEKIAMFALSAEPTHAARQLDGGIWSSKLGNEIDISHNLLGVENDIYGQVAFYMRRPR